jgi:hypothetical protein
MNEKYPSKKYKRNNRVHKANRGSAEANKKIIPNPFTQQKDCTTTTNVMT